MNKVELISNGGKFPPIVSRSHGRSYDLYSHVSISVANNIAEDRQLQRSLEMATSTDDKGWTFDAFDPGTLRELTPQP